MPSADVAFQELVAGSDKVDLVRVLLDLALDAYPDLDVRDTLDTLHDLGISVAARLGSNDKPRSLKSRLLALSSLLYEEEGFHGNEREYYDPRNSYLNEVLDRRCGLPITLAVIYVEMARHAGLPAYGVSTPAHFMVACQERDVTWFVDPFQSGAVMSRRACQAQLERLVGCAPLGDEHFRPATVRDTVCRVLRNLKVAYSMRSAWEDLLPVQRRLALLLPHELNEQRDFGLLLLRTGHPRTALPLLECFVDRSADDDAQGVAPYVRLARRLIAEMN